jgi:hypothetical protein
VTAIELVITRPTTSKLTLTYVVEGFPDLIRLPARSAPARRDGLWQQTCFEAFLGSASDPAYFEFNFSPSSEWAAFRFDSYRSGMASPDSIQAPRIDTYISEEHVRLTASIDLASLPDLPADDYLRLGLSAVIEETNGRKSYWALAHPPGKADFHNAAGFTHQLPGLQRP